MSDTDDSDDELKADEGMADTAAKLDSALDSATNSSAEDGSKADDEEGPDATALIERAETDVESLSAVLSGDARLEDVGEDIEDLIDVIRETNELLETVDLSALPGAIELRDLPEAIDAEEVPEAIANAEPKRAIELRQLASLVDFTELWNAADVRAFVQNKRELEDEVDDATDDGDEDDDDESGLIDSITPSDSSDGESKMIDSIGSSDDASTAEDEESLLENGQAKQLAIQSKLQDAIEEFRESALDARDQLKDARDTAQQKVEEETGGGTGQPSSRNPTAYSTMVSGWKTGGWSSANFSTIPKTTRHSSAPGHFRIYGRRFDEREGNDE